MAAISLTPALEKLCERVQAAGSDFDVMTTEQRQVLATEVGTGHISNQSLRLLQHSLVYFGEEGTLRTYLEGSKVIMPGLVIKHDKVEPSPQQRKRREYLLRQQEVRAYNTMVYGTDYDPHTRDVLTTGISYASVKNQLSIGANAFVAVFAMFGVGYYLGRQYTDDRTQQLIFGLIGAIGILIVEMLLFIRRATQMEQAYEKKPTLNAEAVAQMRSGGLLTALPPEAIERFKTKFEPAVTELNDNLPHGLRSITSLDDSQSPVRMMRRGNNEEDDDEMDHDHEEETKEVETTARMDEKVVDLQVKKTN